MQSIFDTRIEYLKGVGPVKGALLSKELQIFTFGDLIQHYPFRYEDRTKFYKIAELNDKLPFVQIRGRIRHIETQGHQRKKRLIAYLTDGSGEVELIWFRGLQWVARKLVLGSEYVVFGKPTAYSQRYNIVHPEIELLTEANAEKSFLQPIYSTTEKLKSKFLESKAISRLQETLLQVVSSHIHETLPDALLKQYSLPSKREAIIQIHFPSDTKSLARASYRLKFEELLYTAQVIEAQAHQDGQIPRTRF